MALAIGIVEVEAGDAAIRRGFGRREAASLPASVEKADPPLGNPVGGAGAIFDPGSIAARIDAIAYSAVAHMPRTDRHRDSVAFDRP